MCVLFKCIFHVSLSKKGKNEFPFESTLTNVSMPNKNELYTSNHLRREREYRIYSVAFSLIIAIKRVTNFQRGKSRRYKKTEWLSSLCVLNYLWLESFPRSFRRLIRLSVVIISFYPAYFFLSFHPSIHLLHTKTFHGWHNKLPSTEWSIFQSVRVTNWRHSFVRTRCRNTHVERKREDRRSYTSCI